jgi:enamine deaminase RidA (YjgF/YER057c/UK114 family)
MGLQEMSGGKGPESAPNPTSQSIDSPNTAAAGGQPGSDPSQGSGTGGELKLAAWTQQVSKEIRENPELAKELAPFEKLDDLVKAHIDQKKKSAIPGKDAKPEDVAAFWKALGHPEKPDGYTLAKDKTTGTFITAAHAARLTDEQANAMWKEVSSNQNQLIASRQAAQQAELTATMDTLKKEYGEKFAYAVELFDRAVGNSGKTNSPLMQTLVDSGLVGNQSIIRAFIALGEAQQESGSPRSDASPGQSMKSVTEGGWYNYQGSKK